MEVENLPTFKPIIGDDDPYITIALRDLPTGYGFDGLVFDPNKPLTYALKDHLIDVATRYYRNYEIVGETFTDFRENLQLDLDLNVDTFEKMLAVYNDDIAKPTQSREIRRTYDLKDTSNESENISAEGSTNNNNETTNYDIPLDNGTAQGTDKSVSTGTGSNTNNSDRTLNGTNAKTGTEVEYWSDVGVAPNYELLNGFLDNNRTLEQVFISFFKTDFTISEVYYG